MFIGITYTWSLNRDFTRMRSRSIDNTNDKIIMQLFVKVFVKRVYDVSSVINIFSLFFLHRIYYEINRGKANVSHSRFQLYTTLHNFNNIIAT